MNKQEKNELINYIEKHTYVQNTPLGRMETVRSSALIDKIKQLDEPQKVKAPEFVVSLMNKYRSGNPDITYYGFIRICNSKSFDGRKSPEEKLICWLTTKKENESILMKVWIDGSCCEIEQEPKWILRVGEKLLFKEFDDNEFPVFVIDDKPGSTQLAENFDLEKKAHNVQKEVGGTVEKVR